MDKLSRYLRHLDSEDQEEREEREYAWNRLIIQGYRDTHKNNKYKSTKSK